MHGVDNYPTTGWLQLYNELKKDVRTFYTPRWLTDIKWGYSMTAGPAALRHGQKRHAGAAALQTMPQQVADSYPRLLAQPDLNAADESQFAGKTGGRSPTVG